MSGNTAPVTGSIIMASTDLSGSFRDIKHALEHFDKAKTETAFITIGGGLPSYSMGLFNKKHTGECYVFDPHSRDINGLCCQDGKAVITCHENTDELISFFTNLAKSTGQGENTPYELVHCIIKQSSMSDDCQSSFSGFNTSDL